jgi:hypothetical protein
MNRQRGRRLTWAFWLELPAATISGALFLATLIRPDWIEVLFKVSPDGGSGELEWVLAIAFLAVTVVAGLLARHEWRRAAPSSG